jgi:hypothetical protein
VWKLIAEMEFSFTEEYGHPDRRVISTIWGVAGLTRHRALCGPYLSNKVYFREHAFHRSKEDPSRVEGRNAKKILCSRNTSLMLQHLESVLTSSIAVRIDDGALGHW